MKSFTTMGDTATKTFNWLNLEQAESIVEHDADWARIVE